jgi:hypothetical protein
MRNIILAVCLSLIQPWALAQGNDASEIIKGKGEKGWFFFESAPTEEEPEPTVAEPPRTPMPTTPPPPPKEDRCKKKETWAADCGFVNPGEDFEFQAKQRDALLERMSVAQNDPKAVEAFQYYMRWVLDRTSEVTNLWWYNMVQNPDLDPTVSAPISAFGLRLMTDVRTGKSKEVYDLIKEEGGFFVYFSRADCKFCYQMKDPLNFLSNKTGLEVKNASLDDKCMPGFPDCLKAPGTIPPAEMLQVTTVPAVFLYIKPNTWIRVATGVVDGQSMATRAMQFFSAYRNALIKGVENGQKGRASVDFEGIDGTGTGKGITGEASGTIRIPTDDDINKMLRSK